ncbi:hypothetical protein PENTCL1PPCAC_11844 [Pristionchus entomophagus]|uniref:Uncharacterized protein n=1 Tax=Pristionchus entomophagus TaxID=358040 RepID=A0AAV5T7M3_9BILA|nr:hypothetical protein PENTCL1PPCAC_11844 [Pristionchus entomophagus]
MARASSSIHSNRVNERESISIWDIDDDDDDSDVSPPPTKLSRDEHGERPSSSTSVPKKPRFDARKAVCTMSQEEFERVQRRKNEGGFVRARRINREPRSSVSNEKIPSINLHGEQPDSGMTLGELLRRTAGLNRMRAQRRNNEERLVEDPIPQPITLPPDPLRQPRDMRETCFEKREGMTVKEAFFCKELHFNVSRRRLPNPSPSTSRKAGHVPMARVLLAPPIPRLEEVIIEPIQITPFYAPTSTPRLIIPEPRQKSTPREIIREQIPIHTVKYTISYLPFSSPQVLPLCPVSPAPLPEPPKAIAKEEKEGITVLADPIVKKEEEEEVKLDQPLLEELKEEEMEEEWEKWLKEHGENEGDGADSWSVSSSIDDDEWIEDEEDDQEKGWRSRMINERRARIYSALGLRMPPGKPHRNEIRYLRDKVKMKLGAKAESLFGNGKERRRRK